MIIQVADLQAKFQGHLNLQRRNGGRKHVEEDCPLDEADVCGLINPRRTLYKAHVCFPLRPDRV